MFVSLIGSFFDNTLKDTFRDTLNLLNGDLSDAERFVLSHGLNFGLPPNYLCKKDIVTEFEQPDRFL